MRVIKLLPLTALIVALSACRTAIPVPQPPPAPAPAPLPPPPPEPALAPPPEEPVTAPRTPEILGPVGRPRQYTVRVFYGTTRARTGKDLADRYYGATEAARVELGICWITIPATHVTGTVDSPSWVHAEFRRDPARHMVLATVRPLSSKNYFERLREGVGRTEKHELFVFVHGFNNTFEDAALRTAQLAHDIKFQGPAVFFSWPARGGGATGVAAYWNDRRHALEAGRHLRHFLNLVAAESGAEVIHLLVHSMGNLVLERALVDPATNAPRPLAWRHARLHEVALAAPDLSAAGVERIARALRGGSPSAQAEITAYVSSNDRALLTSVAANHGVRPFGLLLGSPAVIPGVDVIDASKLLTDMIGHVAWVENRLGLTDLKKLILEDFPPLKRGLIQLMGQSWWTFP